MKATAAPSVQPLLTELNLLLTRARGALAVQSQNIERAQADAGLSEVTALLDRMAALLSETAPLLSGDDQSDLSAAAPAPSLLDVITDAVHALRPMCEASNVAIDAAGDTRVNRWTSRPAGMVFRRVLEVVIDGCTRAPAKRHDGGERISVMLMQRGDRVELLVEHSCCGEAAQEAIDLRACEQAVRSLGGMIDHVTVPFQRGGVVRVQVPCRQLVPCTEGAAS